MTRTPHWVRLAWLNQRAYSFQPNQTCQRCAEKEERVGFRSRSRALLAKSSDVSRTCQRSREWPRLKSRRSGAAGYASGAGSGTSAAVATDGDPVVVARNEIIGPR